MSRDRTSQDMRLVFFDVETSGLIASEDVILEIGALVTGPDLVPIGSFFHRIPQWTQRIDRILDAASEDFVRKSHRESGLESDSLLVRERLGPNKTGALSDQEGNIRSIDAELVDWLQREHQFAPRTAVIAGHSIHFDRGFVKRWMPKLDAFLHYRMLDVSAIREAYQRWIEPGFGERWKVEYGPPKHRVRNDIVACIDELRVYKEKCFRP